MTDEFYAKLRKPHRRRADRPLWFSIAFVAVLMALILGPLVYMVWYTFHWRDYISDISASTTQAYRLGSLEGTVEGEPVSVTGEHMYALYNRLTKRMGKLYREAPEEEPRIALRYSNGATLEVWEIKLEEDAIVAGKREYCVLWRYTSADGKVWVYDNNLDLYRNIWILVCPAQNQPPE